MGHRHLCGINPCPLLMRAKALSNIERAVSGLDLAGSSPPSVFVGEQGYPKVLAGPLIPPFAGEDAAIMERPDLWLDKTIDEILSFRFNLVRTKKTIPVKAAVDPPRILSETQTLALSEAPTSSEATLLKRPSFTSVFSDRTLPTGPSAPLHLFVLEDNPRVPKAVDKATSDTDLKAVGGIMEMFEGGVHQQQMTRLLSIGLLGEQRNRRLVPTKWSITAVDDIVGKELHKRVLRMPWINDFMVYVDYALGNTVALLFLPRGWQFEAMESWLGGLNPPIITDNEWSRGRKEYARSVAGAYYATRLPALQHLVKMRKQAGVMVFMEIDPLQWVPLGVWRFREIARRALQSHGKKFSSLDEALDEVGRHLRNPIHRWLKVSKLYQEFTTQTLITDFIE
ncbi:MAG: Nre family DNA repair protein [Candidatus Thorarchaeota archaeon]